MAFLFKTGFLRAPLMCIHSEYRFFHKRWHAPMIRALKRRKKITGPDPELPRSAFIEWNYNAELYAFGKRLGEEFQDETIRAVFTHRSYVIKEEEQRKKMGIDTAVSMRDNTELVTEGEGIVSPYVKAFLRHGLPYFPEEGIRAVHDHLVSAENLLTISKNIGIKDLLLCAEFPPGDDTVIKTLMAVIAAIRRDRSLQQAHLFVQDFIITQLAGENINELWRIVNPMGVLSEILAREQRGPPEARLLHESGRNTMLAAFEIGLYSDKQFIGSSCGETLLISEEMAARDALRRLFRTNLNAKPLPFGTDGREMADLDLGAQNVSLDVWTQAMVQEMTRNRRALQELSRKKAVV